MKKIITVVRILLSLFSLAVMGLMLMAVKQFSAYVSVGAVVFAFVLEVLAIVTSFIGAKKGLIVDIISILLTIIAAIIGFVQYSKMPGWSDLQLFAIVCLVFIVAPALDVLILILKKK